MVIFSLAVIVVILYLSSALLQSLAVGGVIRAQRGCVLMAGSAAVLLHALLLHQWIGLARGQNLTVFNMVSLVCVILAVLAVATVVMSRLEAVLLLVFPLAAISILFVLIFPGYYTVDANASPDLVVHVVLVVMAFCVLCLAAIISVLLALSEMVLQYKKAGFLLNTLPPLQSLEKLLFQIMGVGMVLLTIALVNAAYYYHNLVLINGAILQKTVLAIAAWLIFAILLMGRYYYGWRGKKAIYGTLLGVLLLFFTYIGSQFVLKVMGP